jgi:hypothetical protein
MTTRDWSPLHEPTDDAPREPMGSAALGRLVAFRRSLAHDAVIDPASGLGAGDLDAVIELAMRGEADTLAHD